MSNELITAPVTLMSLATGLPSVPESDSVDLSRELSLFRLLASQALEAKAHRAVNDTLRAIASAQNQQNKLMKLQTKLVPKQGLSTLLDAMLQVVETTCPTIDIAPLRSAFHQRLEDAQNNQDDLKL